MAVQADASSRPNAHRFSDSNARFVYWLKAKVFTSAVSSLCPLSFSLPATLQFPSTTLAHPSSSTHTGRKSVKSRSYWYIGRTDSIHCYCYECRQRSQFIEDNAETSPHSPHHPGRVEDVAVSTIVIHKARFCARLLADTSWWHGLVVRTSVFGWRTFRDLRLIYVKEYRYPSIGSSQSLPGIESTYKLRNLINFYGIEFD